MIDTTGPSIEQTPAETALPLADLSLQFAAVAALAAAGLWVVARFHLLRIPREPAGRLPRDPALGALAMLGYIFVGALGVTAAASLEPRLGFADEAYARLFRSSLAGALQAVAVLAILVSPAFIAGALPTARPTRALLEGVTGFAIAVPVVTAVALAVQLGHALLGLPPAPAVSHETLAILVERGDALLTALTLAQVVILVPISEEAAWRGVMQPSFRRAGLGPVASAALVAAIFAAIHWPMLAPEGRATGLAMLALLGFALGILRERTGGLLAPIVLHALFNLMNVAFALR